MSDCKCDDSRKPPSETPRPAVPSAEHTPQHTAKMLAHKTRPHRNRPDVRPVDSRDQCGPLLLASPGWAGLSNNLVGVDQRYLKYCNPETLAVDEAYLLWATIFDPVGDAKATFAARGELSKLRACPAVLRSPHVP
jgi:hypothetical protein